MAGCAICGETLPEGSRTCAVCGTSLPDVVPTAAVLTPPASGRRNSFLAPPDMPAGGRFCPACGQAYGPEFTEAFCACGIELVTREQGDRLAGAASESAPPPAESRASRPPAGTRCLVLYGADRQALAYFPLTKDATLIGRLDAVAGTFPDVDLDEWLDPPQARKISRQHALILHSRANDRFSLRPLAGNTGTQLEAEMVLPLHDYPLAPGQRFILGGVARFKFEVT